MVSYRYWDSRRGAIIFYGFVVVDARAHEIGIGIEIDKENENENENGH
jgi:hypothetical protein